jgi:hypothetical protein
MIDKYYKNPYKGPFAFGMTDENNFFGRNAETRELINLIKQNQLTVFFGASGTGKTSLINAKLLPQLTREYFHPIYIRINFANKEESPLFFVRKRIVEELHKWNKDITDFKENQSLVDFAAKNVIFKGLIKPILFFDQFEEIFTLGPQNIQKNIKILIDELADLIELRLPDDLKKYDYIENITNFKVVFSLRQDWVGYLDDYSRQIPSILENRYRLKKFSPEQAIDAIIGPSKNKVTLNTAVAIIKKIGNETLSIISKSSLYDLAKYDIEQREVDPFVLSLYCYQIYEKAQRSKTENINEDFINHNDDTSLIRAYYEEKLQDQEEIKRIIEEKLLNDSGKRIIAPLSSFTGNNEKLKDEIHAIANNTGIIRLIGMNSKSEIEITHDRLAEVIKESRDEHETKKLNEEAIKKNNEAEELRANAKKKENEAENFKKLANSAKKASFIIAIVAIIFISLIFIWAFHQSAAIINHAKSDYTVQGLQSQLTNLKANNNHLQDSIDNILRLIPAQTKLESAQILDTSKLVSLVKYDSLLKEYNTLKSSSKAQNEALTQTYQSSSNDNAKLITSLNRELDSLYQLLQPKKIDAPTDELSNLKSNIKVLEYCPLGLKSQKDFYQFDDLKYSDLSLKFTISNIKIENFQDFIVVKFRAPINGSNNMRVYIDSSRINITNAFIENYDPNHKFGKGTYSYEILYKNKQLKSGSFEVR